MIKTLFITTLAATVFAVPSMAGDAVSTPNFKLDTFACIDHIGIDFVFCRERAHTQEGSLH